MQYIQENTQIPVPRVHAYGQAQLLRNNSAKQAFMILDHIKGQQLVEKQFSNGSEQHRRQFYSELIDIFAQLRGLEFSAAGSLMPARLEVSGSIPAIVDLRWSNIMVDHELHITGILDWEWAATVPVNNFTPPSWITTSKDYFAEFRSVLASKHGSSAHVQLLKIFRKPHHLVNVFYTFIYPQLYTEPREKVIREYFLCEQKQLELQRLLQNSERYTKYLRENNLFVDDEEADQRENEWMAKVQAYYDSKQKS
ncbi:hypothetical protein CEP54_014782 [Fusarium duplospermum]|uniref:Aminoglycoside phosphotransferase domain-containing protein n=1 Tax=Fusarium duplospermum TaxID=1325734 RepID=A0A428NTW9_9HYPO|nr:hypothetical protein CEP54_014782 [Fusarium duplospermum]